MRRRSSKWHRPVTGVAWRSRCSRNSASPATRSAICCSRQRCWTRWKRLLRTLVAASADLLPLLLVGAPLRHAGALYNCALAIHRGRLLGVVPKMHLPNYREFYEPRHFVGGDGTAGGEIAVGGHTAPFGTDLLFAAEDVPRPDRARRDLRGHLGSDAAQFGEAALAGATVLANLSASNITIGKAETRRLLCALAIGPLPGGLSVRRCRCGRVDHRSRLGRPGLDLRERRDAGRDRAVSVRQPVRGRRYRPRPAAPRAHADGQFRHQPPPPSRAAFRRIAFRLDPPAGRYRPASAGSSAFRSCRPIPRGSSRIATRPTTSRSRAWRSGCARPASKRVVIGVSGGLDSTQALIVVRQALRSARAAARQYPCLHDAGLRHLRAHQGQRLRADGGARRHLASELDIRPAARTHAERHRPPVRARASRSTTSRSRTCRPACAPTICSAWQTTTTASSSAPAICRSWRWAGAPMASATRWRTTTSMPACRRR